MLFLDRGSVPGEEDQLEYFVEATQALGDKPLVIRTLDIGNDKWLELTEHGSATPEETMNSALGLRGVRLTLKNQAMFRTHLRAILRASALGNVRVMLPMVTSIAEINQAKQLLNDIKQELAEENIAFDHDIKLGAMIEIPAAAICAYDIAKALDFVSIGTNDLIQYTLAMDRANTDVEYLYDPYHPAILKLIFYIIRGCNKAGTPVTMCGEMAGETQFTRVLLGFGLRSFSAHWNYLLEIKNIIRQTDIQDTTQYIRQLLHCEQSAEVKNLLVELNH
jgi:phosphotransferase system enzyme I (PtsI)